MSWRFWRRDPKQQLVRKRAELLQQAMELQRAGDLRGQAERIAAAEAIDRELHELERREQERR